MLAGSVTRTAALTPLRGAYRRIRAPRCRRAPIAFASHDGRSRVNLRLEPLPLAGAFLVHRAMHGDARGAFSELWREDEFRDAGLDVRFIQDNWARSKRHVLRGMHFQHANPQGKLVTVIRGSVQDVIIDMRPRFSQRTAARTRSILRTPTGAPSGCRRGLRTGTAC